MKLIDTNVFLYAVGREHHYKEICLRLMGEFGQGRHEVNIDTELLQEVLHHFWSRGRHQDGLEMFDRLVVGFPDPIPITIAEARSARDVLAEYPRLQTRDAVHAAVVLNEGLEGIISADRGFDEIAGLTRFDPKDL